MHYFLIFFLICVRVYLELLYVDIESKGAFFFSKLWFYSLLVFSDVKVAEFLRRNIMKSVIIPFAVFVPTVFIDVMFFFRGFDKGTPLFSFPSSLLSFFLFSQGIPKIGIISFFFVKFFLAILSSSKKEIHLSLLYFITSYFLWQFFHIDHFYGKLKFLFFIFEEKHVYIVSGMIFMFIFIFGFFRDWLIRTLRDGLKNVDIPYIFILLILGYFSSGYEPKINMLLSFLPLLGFYLVYLFFLRLKELIKFKENFSNLDDLIKREFSLLVFLIFSIFSATRGIFVVPLPIIILLFAIYHLPPLSVGERLFGFPLFGVFSVLLFFLAYLAPGREFFISREAMFISLAVFIFSSLEYMTLRIEGNLKRIFASLTSLSPAFFIHAPEDILLSAFLAFISFRFPGIRWIRFISAAYFVSKYSYMKLLAGRITP